MYSLLSKIFFAYWMAASLVIVIADFEPHSLIHTPELTDALNTSLARNADSLISAYKAGTCVSTLHAPGAPTNDITLTRADGHVLCGNMTADGDSQLIRDAVAEQKLISRSLELYQVLAAPVRTPDGNQYVLLVKSPYKSALHFFGLLPGIRTLETSVTVTFFLGILVAWQFRRLRAAARQIADGDLGARVKLGRYSQMIARVGIRDDIDELTRDFNTMADRLQSLVAAHKLLIRDVSHELRSPLARLAVALELARDSPPSDVRVHLARIEHESLRLNSLIAHLLSFSYIDSIRDLPHSVLVNLTSLVQEVMPDVQYEAAGRHCSIITRTNSDSTVTGDSEMLRRALENIVRNAIRYSPTGGTVEITIDREERDGRLDAVLRVSDSGPGVAEEKLEQILNPFYRAVDVRRSSSSGFGIGLAIADRAARLHSGHIVAKNRAGGGLVVEMCLPLSPAS
jgi:two-component system, OmpR family, sensor histidine kinase CpxA